LRLSGSLLVGAVPPDERDNTGEIDAR